LYRFFYCKPARESGARSLGCLVLPRSGVGSLGTRSEPTTTAAVADVDRFGTCAVPSFRVHGIPVV